MWIVRRLIFSAYNTSGYKQMMEKDALCPEGDMTSAALPVQVTMMSAFLTVSLILTTLNPSILQIYTNTYYKLYT